MRKSALLIAPMLILGAMTLTGGAALAADSASASSPTTIVRTAPAATGTITIKNFAFQGPGTVASGAKITVTNQDSEAHTVTADSGGAFDVTIAPGSSATFTAPTAAGTYAFHCEFHANMHGSLVVQAASSSAPAPTQAPAAPQSSAPQAPQMTQMPAGAPATGVAKTADPAGDNFGLIGGGAFLVLAGGGVYALRRRTAPKA